MLDTSIVESVRPSPQKPRQVEYEFKRLLRDGFRIRPAGRARARPNALLSRGYTPKHKIQLFDATYYLTNMRHDDDLRFLVAYVIPSRSCAPEAKAIYPRLIYKDSSLVWRSPTHYIRSPNENWIGKGDLKRLVFADHELEYTAEETTNLPLEVQSALDVVSRRSRTRLWDAEAVDLLLRRAPEGRFEPYRDFCDPRQRAMADERNRVHDGRFVADFAAANDPTSLRFVKGFEPDFEAGLVDEASLQSRFYGGRVSRYRILSSNKRIQYQFISAPRHTWIIPPQPLTTEIMSYGVRTVDVNAHEDLFVPGYEFHYVDDSVQPPQPYSQIPEGYAGAAHETDPSRADASAWLDQLAVIQEFRRKFPQAGNRRAAKRRAPAFKPRPDRGT